MCVNEKNTADAASNRIGLLFTGGEGPSAGQCIRITEEARSLSCGIPLIAAADSGLLLAEKAGIEPDWIIGDMDSLGTEASRLKNYPAEKILTYPTDKDFTDTELAFTLLREKGGEKIWIIGGGGGRIDQLFGIRSLFERDYPPERWITAGEDIHCIEPGNAAISSMLAVSPMLDIFPLLDIRRPAHTGSLSPVSVFPLGSGPWEVESSGLSWPLAGLGWNRGFFGLSNEAPGGSFTVTARQGRFMVITPL